MLMSLRNGLTPSPPTKGSGFRRFDSSRLLNISGGNSHVRRILYVGSLPESLTEGPLVGELLIGGLGVLFIIWCVLSKRRFRFRNVKCFT